MKKSISKPLNKWIEDLKKITIVTIPSSVVEGKVLKLKMHRFSYVSKLSVCAAVYLIVMYDNLETSSSLLVAKSRIEPRGLFILQKELVEAHLLTNLMRHVKESLQRGHEIGEYHGCKIVFYWLATTQRRMVHICKNTSSQKC